LALVLKLEGSDGTTRCAPGFAACGDILRDSRGGYVISFYVFLDIQHAFYIEVIHVLFLLWNMLNSRVLKSFD